jgi:hypothetical protein
MNVIKILLIVGLIYAAMTQKSEKTKNMLLVVTALLAFCMVSMEGFTLQASTGADATCSETATDTTTTPDCANAFGQASATTAEACPPGCTYTAAVPAWDAGTAIATEHLPILFPSCISGNQVKASGGTMGAMCQEATLENISWADYCGENAECNASVGFLGGEKLSNDNTNQCGSSLYGSWPHTCSCIDDGTWSPDTDGTGNGCTASSS